MIHYAYAMSASHEVVRITCKQGWPLLCVHEAHIMSVYEKLIKMAYRLRNIGSDK